MNRKIILMMVLVSTVSVISTAFVVNSINQNTSSESNNSEDCNEYHYSRFTRSYDLSIDSEGNYTVLVPVVLDNCGISFMMDGLKLVEGNASFEIVKSTYGPALKVSGSGTVRLHSDVCIKALWGTKKTYPLYAELCNNEKPVDIFNLVIALSMTNYSSLKWDSKNGTYIENGTGYNTTNLDFRKSEMWLSDVDSLNLYMKTEIYIHSFVYVSSERPINISMELSESLMHSPKWILHKTFTENGWHYVEVEVKEEPTPLSGDSD